jgi:hypothetical protein
MEDTTERFNGAASLLKNAVLHKLQNFIFLMFNHSTTLSHNLSLTVTFMRIFGHSKLS